MSKSYTGIGSRETPPNMLEFMKELGAFLAVKGYTLRSGGADGADTAFEIGCDKVNGSKEIYLPWQGFNNNVSQLFQTNPEAIKIAAGIHPSWEACSQEAKKLHARNIHQVLGAQLATPSNFVIYWAETSRNGEPKGGTRTAVVLAAQRNIPTYNLKDEITFHLWKKIVTES